MISAVKNYTFGGSLLLLSILPLPLRLHDALGDEVRDLQFFLGASVFLFKKRKRKATE